MLNRSRGRAKAFLAVVLLTLCLSGCGPPATCWSPDGARLAVLAYEGLYCFNPRTSQFLRLARGQKDRRQVFDPSWAPDSRRLCYVVVTSKEDRRSCSLWKTDAVTGAARLLVPRIPITTYEDDNPSNNHFMMGALPVWSPDGRTIAYSGHEEGKCVIWMVSAEGGAPKKLLPRAPSVVWPAWSPDGKWLAYSAAEPQRPHMPTTLELVRADGSGRRLLWRAPRGYRNFGTPRWSADGRRVAVECLRSGEDATIVWVISAADGRAVRLAKLPETFRLLDYSADLSEVWWVGDKPNAGSEPPRGLMRANFTVGPQYLFTLEKDGDDCTPALSPDHRTLATLVTPSEERARLRLQTGRKVRFIPVPR